MTTSRPSTVVDSRRRSSRRRQTSPGGQRCPLLMVRRGSAVRRHHDLEWGRPRHRRPSAAREALPEGIPGRSELAHHFAQARAIPQRVQGLRHRGGCTVRSLQGRAALADTGIVHNPAKIKATVNNARRCTELLDEFGSLAAYVWQFEPGQPGFPPPSLRPTPGRAGTGRNGRGRQATAEAAARSVCARHAR